jgi:hypothetical protein
VKRFGHYHDYYDWRYASARTKKAAMVALRKKFKADLKMDLGGNDWEVARAKAAKFKDGEVMEIGQERHQFGPRPKCCKLVNKRINHEGPAILLKIHRYDRKKDKKALHVRWELEGIGLEITHCPFCGTKLPRVILKKKPPQPIYVPDGDEGHCVTCDSEDHGWCQCNPASAGYKLKS